VGRRKDFFRAESPKISEFAHPYLSFYPPGGGVVFFYFLKRGGAFKRPLA